jgi:hypothetical protein
MSMQPDDVKRWLGSSHTLNLKMGERHLSHSDLISKEKVRRQCVFTGVCSNSIAPLEE